MADPYNTDEIYLHTLTNSSEAAVYSLHKAFGVPETPKPEKYDPNTLPSGIINESHVLHP